VNAYGKDEDSKDLERRNGESYGRGRKKRIVRKWEEIGNAMEEEGEQLWKNSG